MVERASKHRDAGHELTSDSPIRCTGLLDCETLVVGLIVASVPRLRRAACPLRFGVPGRD